MTSAHHLNVRSQLLNEGYTRSAIQHRVDSSQWTRVFNGMYLCAQQDGNPTEPDALDVARTAAVLARGGERSVLSHRTAALHHGLDSINGWGTRCIDLTVSHRSRAFAFTDDGDPASTLTVHRTRHLPDATAVVTDLHGFRYTDRARTLLDLAAILSIDDLFIALESGLRGPDPRRPDVWREDVVGDLERMTAEWRRKPGVAAIRRLLQQRPAGRPAGSIAEAVLLWALLASGIDGVVVQPRILARDRNGNVRVHFVDLMLPAGQLIIEVDGAFHDEATRRASDYERDRRLAPGFHIFRYPASVALFDPDRIVGDVRSHLSRTANVGNSWEVGGRRVQGQGHEWTISTAAR